MQGSPIGVGVAPGRRRAWDRALAGLRVLICDRRLMLVALAAILLLGASMRLTGVNWDEGTHLHPDERFLTDVTSRLRWPQDIGEYFDEARSPLNPHNQGFGMFVYGTLPMFIVKGAAIALDLDSFAYIHLVGRAFSALYDLAVVLLVFFIGRRLYGRSVGLLASFLMACTVLNIQHAHFYTVEAFITLLVTLAFYFAVRVVQGGRWLDWALTGVAFGLALAGKISMATFLMVIGMAGLMRAGREAAIGSAGDPGLLCRHSLGPLSFLMRVNGEDGRSRALAGWLRALLRAGLGLGLALAVALIAFRVTQPYAFTGPSPFSLRLSPRWLNDMATASRLVSGAVDFPPGHQWADREPVWFAWRNMVIWGMGLPLGLAAWAGWLVACWELWRKRKVEHVLLLLWVTFTFLYHSTQHVKSIRYFLPIYPLLVILAAYFVVWLWRQAQGLRAQAAGHRRAWVQGLGARAPVAAGLVGALVLVGTLLYAQAFTNIYRRTHSRVAASRWVYENIPPGASLTWERWDDTIPQNVDGKDASRIYNLVATDPFGEDTPEKLEAMLQWLDEADYVILASNRGYDSIVRLPGRFPLTVAYYRYLFSGELGFEAIRTFTSYPNLGPIQFVSDTADEAFTVYDHPKVTIFRKTPAYSSARARELLGDIYVGNLMRMSALDATRSRHGMMLSAEEWQAQVGGGTWSEMFRPDDLANRLPVLAWLIVLQFLALAAFPFAFVAFRRFPNRGFIFAKTLGLLVVAYLAWLGASLRLVPYTRMAILGATLLCLAVGAWVAWRCRAELGDFFRQRWQHLLLEEALFLAFFGAFLLVRWGNPDLWHPVMGGEKPMNLAYLNAIIRSTWFPPYDPWFAGGYINYYYFGHVIVATLCKLTGIVPAVAFNLALPTISALTAMGGYTVVSALLQTKPGAEPQPALGRAARYGLFGALLIAVLGNLGQVRLLVEGLQRAAQIDFRSSIPGLAGLVELLDGLFQAALAGRGLGFRPEWWYWNASRIMGAGEINEFPYFTFLYGDLHAHFVAMPIGLLALGLTVSLLLNGRSAAVPEASQAAEDGGWSRRWWRWVARADWSEWLVLGLLALTLGGLWVTNTWDYPTYALVVLGGLALGCTSTYAYTGPAAPLGRTSTYAYTGPAAPLGRMLRPEGVAWGELGGVVGRFLGLVVASLLLFQPFHARYGAAYTSLELWRGPRTQPSDYGLIHGLFLFILITYALSRALGYQARGALARSVRLALGRPLQQRRLNRLTARLVLSGLGYQLGYVGIIVTLGVSALSILGGWWVVGLALPLLLAGMVLALRRDLAPAERLAAWLFVLGLAITAAVEVVVLRGDIGRMNTVFKFYLQAWVLWGVAAAIALAVLAGRWQRWPAGWRSLWQAGLGLLLFGAALYPLTATFGKINDRFDPRVGPTLDGTAFARLAVYHEQGQVLALDADMQAIRWLLENVQGSPVILEGNTPPYRWGSRVSVYTGLPTVIGWDWHQRQQRAAVPNDVVGWRLEDVRKLYDGTDISETIRVLRKYDVAYVYVGQLERALYHPDGLAKFDRHPELFQPVYRQGPVTIYKVLQESQGGLSTHPFPAASAPAGWPLPRLVQVVEPTAVGPAASAARPLMLDGPVDTLPVVNDRGWNPLANRGPLEAAATWWLALALLGWVAWPLCLGPCRALPDRGYLVAKAVGWLLAGYGVWLGASSRLLSNEVAPIYGVVALLAGLGVWAGYRRRRELAALWRARRGLLLREELLFSGAFAALVLVRLLNPDLWHPWFGGEKRMGFAFLNAILRSAHFPPYDPYFAGGYINYYYYGLYLVNLLVKFTGVVAEVAYNLAVPTFFALTVALAFSLGHALTARLRGRRWLWGGAAAALGVAVLGNLTVLVQWLASMVAAGGGMPTPESGQEALGPLLTGMGRWLGGRATVAPFDYWYLATRVIPFTINEFPFFSFLFADLHPHMMGIPFTVATLVLLAAQWLTVRGPRDSCRRRQTLAGGLGAILLVALTAGALGPINTWDLPTYLSLVVVVLAWLAVERGRAWPGIPLALATAGLALLLYLPFYTHYSPLGVAPGFLAAQTRLRFFLVVWGLWVVALYGWLLARWWRDRDGTGPAWAVWRRAAKAAEGYPEMRTSVSGVLLAGAVALAAAALLAGSGVVAVLLPLVALGLDLWLRPLARPAERLAGLLAAAGCLILAGTEFVFLADFMRGSEWQRMNTVFKFGIQVWVLFGLASAVGLHEVLPRAQGVVGRPARLAWGVAVAGLVGISLAYVPLGTAARVAERFPGGPPPVGTLDGLAYMRSGVYHWPDESHPIVLRYDYEAIRWLLANVRGTPVIAEAPLPYYREGGMRVSSYTGLPTLLGAHQSQQRPAEVVRRRGSQAEELFRTADPERTLSLMRELRVQYVYFGQLEEVAFGESSRAKFETLAARGDLEVVYSNPEVVILRFALP